MEKRDLRYKIEHVGDLFVEILEGIGISIARQFRGISITHDIHGIERKKKEVVYQIGARVTEIRKVQPDLLAGDEPMTKLFTEFDQVSCSLDELIQEREERLGRMRGKIKAAMEAVADHAAGEMAAATA